MEARVILDAAAHIDTGGGTTHEGGRVSASGNVHKHVERQRLVLLLPSETWRRRRLPCLMRGSRRRALSGAGFVSTCTVLV